MDQEIASLIKKEEQRQNDNIELIASENYPSKDVREACGSILMAKYAEGYPNKRYYGGCEYVDEVETLAIERAKALFHCSYANVQPHSGSQANYAAYHALIPNGSKIMALTLNDGGHLTHGSPVSFSSATYRFCFYSLGEDGRIDYEELERRLYEEEPDLLLAGYSAYPFSIDFKRMRSIVNIFNLDKNRHCYFMVDMAHIAGIVAAGLCQNPCDYADIVTSTTHKTLRGPRGGLILSNDLELGKKINSAVFPYTQGGPLEHIIAGKAICFLEDSKPEFKDYMARVLENTKACNDELSRLGCKVSGTENHLFLLDVLSSYGLNGKEAETKLGEIGVTVNKNMIHDDTLPPSKCSGIRIGFAAATTRGARLEDAKEVARLIDACLKGKESKEELIKRRKAIVSNWADVLSL
ncbi:MAG: serine hydroxymethyltransferase [Erysipelotrichaceae bacterium]|jgi:glycine hydroxymethyltransferase|nr:serine hydroxymethyltransferase [Erysipelotrichaceae bacterium]